MILVKIHIRFLKTESSKVAFFSVQVRWNYRRKRTKSSSLRKFLSRRQNVSFSVLWPFFNCWRTGRSSASSAYLLTEDKQCKDTRM